jgi:tetratricopeptide (TPR) repeat protein
MDILAQVRARQVEGGLGVLRRSLLGAAAAGAVALYLGGCGGSSKSSTRPNAGASYGTLVGASVALLGKGNPSAAQQLLQEAIARKPRDPVAYYDLGVAYERQGDTRQAARNYLHAIAVDRNYVPALFNQAEIFAKRNPPLAIFYYRRIIHLKPDSPTAYLNLGLLEAATPALHAQALRDLAHAVKLDPSLRKQVPPPLRAQVPKR